MSRILYRTVANESPQGKPRVWFSCHPGDFEKYFKEYASKILRIQDCVVWYESEPDAGYDAEELSLCLSQMQLFVVPVTTDLLTKPNRAMDVEFPLALKLHIPVLPLMMEQGLDDAFAKRFGDLQYLDPNSSDPTKRGFDETLESYIRSVLVSDELAAKVRAAFDAYVFLSYRKKDRKKAQDLMRLIHKNPVCRDIAIWYDEFLTPGEDFNQAISDMLKKSDLFALVVTPNLVNEVNYVMTTEYPAALEQKKPVLPVEMEATDRGELGSCYAALPPCVRGEDGDEFHDALLEKLRALAITVNDEEPEHNYLIGLAYLDGIDVEVDGARAFRLISGAAKAGVPEAMQQLVTMYETGKGVERDYNKGAAWREKHVAALREAYMKEPTKENARRFICGLRDLGRALSDLNLLGAAVSSFLEMCGYADRYVRSGDGSFRDLLSDSYNYLGLAEKERGDLSAAEEYYRKGLEISEQLADEINTAEARTDLALNYSFLGEIAESRGDLSAAEKYYTKGLEIFEPLVKENGTARLRRALAVSCGKLGRTAELRGDLDRAREYYERAYSIEEFLIGEIEEDVYFESFAGCDLDLGHIAEIKGDLSSAEEHYKKALDILLPLVGRNGKLHTRQLLEYCYGKLGDVALLSGDLAAAQGSYTKSLEICLEIAKDTESALSRRDLAVSYDQLGDIARARGDLPEARKYYESALGINKAMAEETDTAGPRRGISVAYLKLGDVEGEAGDPDAAEEYYKKALELMTREAEQNAAVKPRQDLADVFSRLGDIAYFRWDYPAAREYYKRSETICDELLKLSREVKTYTSLAFCCGRLAEIAENDEDAREVLRCREKILETELILVEEIGETRSAKDLAQAYFDLGSFYYRFRHDKDKAKEMLRRALDVVNDHGPEESVQLAEEAKMLLRAL